jgi:hypothetical protein
MFIYVNAHLFNFYHPPFLPSFAMNPSSSVPPSIHHRHIDTIRGWTRNFGRTCEYVAGAIITLLGAWSYIMSLIYVFGLLGSFSPSPSFVVPMFLVTLFGILGGAYVIVIGVGLIIVAAKSGSESKTK